MNEQGARAEDRHHMMTDEDLRWKLCVYDERNPAWQYLKDSYEEGEDKPTPNAKSCGCDNCFYGRSEMARELLEARRFKREWSDRESSDSIRRRRDSK